MFIVVPTTGNTLYSRLTPLGSNLEIRSTQSPSPGCVLSRKYGTLGFHNFHTIIKIQESLHLRKYRTFGFYQFWALGQIQTIPQHLLPPCGVVVLPFRLRGYHFEPQFVGVSFLSSFHTSLIAVKKSQAHGKWWQNFHCINSHGSWNFVIPSYRISHP